MFLRLNYGNEYVCVWGGGLTRFSTALYFDFSLYNLRYVSKHGA